MRTIVLGVSIGCATACRGASHTQSPSAASESQPVADPHAQRAIDEAERTLEVAGSDCAASCAAVAKITEARIKLCTPRTSACDEAERREDAARRNVASYCGKCP